MKLSLLSLSFLFAASVSLTGCSSVGTDNAQLEADISPVIPKVNSTVTAVFVSDNQQIKKGDTLVILDNATFSIAEQQAEIALLQASRNDAYLVTNHGGGNLPPML